MEDAQGGDGVKCYTVHNVTASNIPKLNEIMHIRISMEIIINRSYML